MNPKRVWGSNCRTWGSFDVEIPAGITALVGANGAGKSTVLNSIDVALFGKGPELARMLTRDGGESTVEVGLEFEHNGDLFRVRRSAGKKTRLDFERLEEGPDDFAPDWATLSLETMKATQARIDQTLGLSRQTFRASSFLAQGDGSAFSEAQPRDRKAILADVLRLQIYEQLLDRAKADRAAAEQELAKLVAQAEQIDGQLTLRDTHSLRQAEARMELDKARLAVADLEAGLASAQAALTDARVLQERRTAAAATLARLEAEQRDDEQRIREHEGRLAGMVEEPGKRDRAEQLVARIGQIRDQLQMQTTVVAEQEQRAADRTRAADDLERAERNLADATAAADHHVRLLTHLGEARNKPHDTGTDVCPTCLRALAGDTAASQAVAAQVAQRQQEAEELRDAALARAAEARKQADTLRVQLADTPEPDPAARTLLAEIQQELAQAETADRWLLAANEALTTRAIVEEQLSEIRGRCENRGAPIADARATCAELLDQDIGPLETAVRYAAASLQIAQSRVSEWDRAEAAETAALARLDELAAQAQELATSRTQLAGHVTVLRELERAYGRDGIPALILESSAIPYLEAEASRIVGELGRSYRFELRTQRATQAGGIADALDIVVHTDTGEALYEDFSGGERTRLDLGLRIALARLLAARRGADVRLLAIDEPAYLDEQGFAQLAALLRTLTEFDRVLIVSHVSALRDAFDSYIEVAGGAETGEPSRIVNHALQEVAA